MKTTLNQIRAQFPCQEGWKQLLKTLGKTKGDDEPVTILQILDSNGLDDALWSLRTVEGWDKEIRLYTVWCARQVQHLLTDERSLKALEVAENFANGTAKKEELGAARVAAFAAACAVTESAAWAAACAAAEFAAWAAAGVAHNAHNAHKAQETELRRLCIAWEQAK